MRPSEFLKKHCWLQGKLSTKLDDGQMAYCIMGVIHEVMHTERYHFEEVLFDLIPEKYCQSAVIWNDQPERTKKEVVELLEIAEKIFYEGALK